MLIDADRLCYIVDHLDEISRGECRRICMSICARSCLLHQYMLLIGWSRIAEDDPHEEPVELSLRERIGALVFERILCCEYDKRRWQIESLISDGDFFLFHSFEERRLHLGWSTVDLVRQEDMGEYRSLAYLKCSLRLSVYLTSREVGWQEIRSEGYTTRVESEYACKSPDRLGLPKTRNSLEECVSTREECNDEFLDESILTDDLLLDLRTDRDESIVDMGEGWVHRSERLIIIKRI